MTLLTVSDVTEMLGKGTTVLVTDIATGKVIVRQWFHQARHAWPSVELDIAAWFDCEPEDACLIETDDGEFVAIKGDVVAKYEHVR